APGPRRSDPAPATVARQPDRLHRLRLPEPEDLRVVQPRRRSRHGGTRRCAALTFERLCDRLAAMELALQSSLFEHAERRHIGNGAWIDYRSGWLDDDAADSLFLDLHTDIPWHAERR